MKLLSIAIPSYNSQDYLHHAVETLLSGGDDVEILIVDDGSKDRTAEIADEFERRNPGIVRAIHKENGGHGDAVMTGLANATGRYFKVVDSDDWVDEESFKRVLARLKAMTEKDESVDMLICNYVYDKVGVKHKHVMQYRSSLPIDRVFGWDEVNMGLGHYLLMHSVIYRTQLLRDCGLSLPKHTFYVDELYVYQPMTHVQTMLYLDEDLYHYFIGRDDQSVNEKVMISRIDQQILVTKLMLGYYDVTKIKNPKLRHYMVRYLEIMMTVTSILAIRSETEENLKKKKELWQYLKQQNFTLYMRLRWGFLGQGVNLPGKGGRKVSIACYKISQKFYGFN